MPYYTCGRRQCNPFNDSKLCIDNINIYNQFKKCSSLIFFCLLSLSTLLPIITLIFYLTYLFSFKIKLYLLIPIYIFKDLFKD